MLANSSDIFYQKTWEMVQYQNSSADETQTSNIWLVVFIDPRLDTVITLGMVAVQKKDKAKNESNSL